ncbi:malto-oligosyltrehalose trehalohydrolase [Sphingobacterium bambusae]|uniref:Malto-oligosyltrehalose trehalohydrolase n=1 Tax=Sphingobacterium bambusae TaxID=662858 RepID=A0ABW6BC66_9SPHI|nr:malto-oligosyltrehalose trehalohydrolase [Sphingobacterium bambusae]WPL48342.1 malto-oligosyltrehalose trehalohydrolase [Sphingobacterium bambusae]
MHSTTNQKIGLSITDKRAHLRVWAPLAKKVDCLILANNSKLSLQAADYGYWQLDTDILQEGDLYRLLVDEKELPDPASRAQPEGVHGPSAVVDLAYAWTDLHYGAPKQRELVIYELHIGTFSDSHDFQGVINRLPYLRELGINAIEIMPVAQFPGERNWGYDGVFLFAVQNSYGGAKGLQALVDACHASGIAVILDVVYNHFGPEGNYLPEFAPYLTDKYGTPWGKAVNFDDVYNYGVRDFVLDNVRMWFEDFHIDGLRMDAVHAIKDFSPVHILQDIRTLTDAIMLETGRSHYLFVECDLNDRRYLEPLAKNGFAMDGQWLDEFHHALRVAVGEERKGYYAEFNGVAHLAKAYQDAYVFDGNFSFHRKKFFGSSADGLAAECFVVFAQNHDQVGNRMLGERSATLFAPAAQRLMAMAVSLSPFTPMLFMGEEWGAQTPFQYFVSHGDDELIEAVRKGRKQEFSEFHASGEPPDPQAISTYRDSILDWKEMESAYGQQNLSYYKALLHLRKTLLSAVEWSREQFSVKHDQDRETITLHIQTQERDLLCIFNFSSHKQEVPLRENTTWSVLWNSDDESWGGNSKMDPVQRGSAHLSELSGLLLQHSRNDK